MKHTYKRIFIKPLATLLLIITITCSLSSCSFRKVDSTKLFNDNTEAFQFVAEYLNNTKYFPEITTDNPLLDNPLLIFMNVKYERYGYIFFLENKVSLKSEIQNVKQIYALFKACSLVRIIVPENEDVVVFQTEPMLNDEYCIVYTKNGKQYSDEYKKLTKWLSNNWYISKSL